MTRCADLRILQPLDPCVDAAFLHPRRHRGVEAGRAGRVGVHVGADRQAFGARRFDLRDRLAIFGQFFSPAALR